MRSPFTASDLKEIAKRLAYWERAFFDKSGEFTDKSNLVNRIEVHRPDDPTEVIGHFVFADGTWLGFDFLEASD